MRLRLGVCLIADKMCDSVMSPHYTFHEKKLLSLSANENFPFE